MGKRSQVEKKAQYHHGDLRAQLIEATRELVEEAGPERFSVAEACRRAGVSTAAPYRHFDTKEDIIDAVIMDGMRRMSAEMETRASVHPQGSIEALAAIGATYLDFAVREPGVFRLMFAHVADTTREQHLAAVGKECHEVLLRAVAAFLGRETLDEEVMRRAFPLWTVVHGMAFLMIDGKLKAMELPVDPHEVLLDAGLRLLT